MEPIQTLYCSCLIFLFLIVVVCYRMSACYTLFCVYLLVKTSYPTWCTGYCVLVIVYWLLCIYVVLCNTE